MLTLLSRGAGSPRVRRCAWIHLVVAVLAAVGVLALPAMAYPRPTSLSQIDNYNPKSASGSHSSISANGRWIAYEKQRDPRLPIQDIFVFDTKTGQNELVSKGMHGTNIVGADAPIYAGCNILFVSCNPVISGNGRYVAYMSSGVNIVEGDTNGMFDVFLYDRRKGGTELISVNSDGEQGDLNSYFPSISFNGRFVSMTSDATNLVKGDTNRLSDIFLRDRNKKKTMRVSVTSGANEASLTNCLGLPQTPAPEADFVINQLACGSGPARSSLSYDGNIVAFESTAADLVPGDKNRVWDVFVHDVDKKKTERISVSTSGEEGRTSARWVQFHWGSRLTAPMGGASSVERAVSANGRYVTYSSVAENLVPNDTNGYDDVFVRDLRTNRTTRVSAFSTGRELGNAWGAGISGNGRYVLYTGERQGGHWGGDLYRYDTLTGELTYNYVKMKPGTVWAAVYNFGDLSYDGTVASAFGFYERWDEIPFDGAPHGRVESDGSGAHIFKWFFGKTVGSQKGGDGPGAPDPTPEGICIADVCIPPDSSFSVPDRTADISGVLAEQGADLRSASIAYRPSQRDVFVVTEVEAMPDVVSAVSANNVNIVHGMRFTANGKHYEVRASSLRGGTFDLFDCSRGALGCTNVAALAGGYGTTGTRIVFSLPLSNFAFGETARLSNVEVFSALGSPLSGPIEVVDSITLN